MQRLRLRRVRATQRRRGKPHLYSGFSREISGNSSEDPQRDLQTTHDLPCGVDWFGDLAVDSGAGGLTFDALHTFDEALVNAFGTAAGVFNRGLQRLRTGRDQFCNLLAFVRHRFQAGLKKLLQLAD